MSQLNEYFPSNTSGAQYSGVPHILFDPYDPIRVPNPQSMILTLNFPSSNFLSKMFYALRSRCAMPKL